mmetsp:Transcript_4867/g.8342  ORF Transcript_4867/g.8342 Transcript_4867/m.8342 type:complete len:102 (-) Transcript_4867:477-782(-)
MMVIRYVTVFKFMDLNRSLTFVRKAKEFLDEELSSSKQFKQQLVATIHFVIIMLRIVALIHIFSCFWMSFSESSHKTLMLFISRFQSDCLRDGAISEAAVD